MKKAVILARVSTKRQEEEGLSLNDIQLPRLKKYAADKGFEVPESAIFVFQESADEKIRHKFSKMLSYVKKKKISKQLLLLELTESQGTIVMQLPWMTLERNMTSRFTL